MNMPLLQVPPPLQDGDRLTRDEFERRYAAMPGLKKAELIEGVVYMPSPVRYDQHGSQHTDLVGVAFLYRVFTPGVGVGVDSTVRLEMESEPQPDALMFIEKGGQVRIEDGYITGAPDWAGEVSASSVGLDLGRKFQLFRKNGVREYVVWRVLDQEIDWFVLRGDDFQRLAANDAGILCSTVFPGFWLDPVALVRGDLLRVHDVLQLGLHTAEHAAFVNELRQRAGA